MRSAIVIAYHFPPDGAAGSHRPLRFVQNLQQFGWRSVVISEKKDVYLRYDPRLLDGIPAETEIIRLPNRDLWQWVQTRRTQRALRRLAPDGHNKPASVGTPRDNFLRSRIREMVRRVEAWAYHPDPSMCWIRPAVKAALEVCDRAAVRVIYASGGPWSSFVVAERVSRKTGIPYVLDFRDSWTLCYDDFDLRRPAWAIQSNRRLLYKLLRGAQSVIFRYASEAECYWRAYRGALTTSQIHIIPNGYSGQIDEFIVPSSTKLTIFYAGTVAPYDYGTLLKALLHLKETEPNRAAQVECLFVGEGTDVIANEAAAAGLGDIVHTTGAVPYSKVVELQRNAHALLLLGVRPMRGYELCGSKVFSYLKANRPILGILSREEETTKLLRKIGVLTIARSDSVHETVGAIRMLLDAWSTGTLGDLLPNQAMCEAFSGERQTAALARALEGVPAVEPFVPGSVDIPPSLREQLGHGDWVNSVPIRRLLVKTSPNIRGL